MPSYYDTVTVKLGSKKPHWRDTGTNTNSESWDKIEAHLQKKGRDLCRNLADLIPLHVHGTANAQGRGGGPFIRHCLRRHYLVDV